MPSYCVLTGTIVRAALSSVVGRKEVWMRREQKAEDEFERLNSGADYFNFFSFFLG